MTAGFNPYVGAPRTSTVRQPPGWSRPHCTPPLWGFPGGSEAKKLPASAGDAGPILGLGRPPGEGNGNPPQCSCLENPVVRGAWRATVPGVSESDTTERLNDNAPSAAAVAESGSHLPAGRAPPRVPTSAPTTSALLLLLLGSDRAQSSAEPTQDPPSELCSGPAQQRPRPEAFRALLLPLCPSRALQPLPAHSSARPFSSTVVFLQQTFYTSALSSRQPPGGTPIYHCLLSIATAQSLSHVQLLQRRGPQHARLPCPSPPPGVCSDSCPSSR